MRLPHRRALTGLIALLCCAAGSAQSQVLRGTVVDSAGRIPIIGAVVTLLDSGGANVARVIVSERGSFAMALPLTARTVRAVRIGFRPREIRIAPVQGNDIELTVAMLAIPTMLEPARVAAKQCPRRNDAAQALGLWEQASAALLTSVVAREQKPASMVRLGYRQMLAESEEIDRQIVVVDTVENSPNSYRAPDVASRFIERGFSSVSGGKQMYDAPDAEVLLDPSFANGYCFRIAPAQRARRNQVGLGFAAADRRPNRVDIEGVLWIDTLAKELRDIEFEYRGVPKIIEGLHTGGAIAFTEMPNGVIFPNRWNLRLADVDRDLIAMRISRSVGGALINNGGGEVAHAQWSDSVRYDAKLGRLLLTVRTPSGVPAVGRWLNLLETSYQKQLDTSGVFDIPDLLPGPYHLVVREPGLNALGMDSIATTFRFNAVRDSTHRAALVLPSLDEWVLDRCKKGSRSGETGSTLILGRVMTTDGRPLPGIRYEIFAKGDTALTVLRRGWETDGAGLFEFCTDAVAPGSRIAIALARGREELGRMELSLDPEPLTVIPIKLRP